MFHVVYRTCVICAKLIVAKDVIYFTAPSVITKLCLCYWNAHNASVRREDCI